MKDDTVDYSDLLDRTVDMENPFLPAPLGDTVIMEHDPQTNEQASGAA